MNNLYKVKIFNFQKETYLKIKYSNKKKKFKVIFSIVRNLMNYLIIKIRPRIPLSNHRTQIFKLLSQFHNLLIEQIQNFKGTLHELIH